MLNSRMGLLVFAAAVTSPFAAHAQDNPPSEYRYYFKERIPLKLDPNRVAVFRTDTFGNRFSQPELSAHGIGILSDEDSTMPGWYIARLAAGAARVSMRDRVLDLAYDPTLEFAAPVFIGNDGGTVVPTQIILAGFSAELTEAECADLIAQMGIGDVIKADYANTKNLYKIRSQERSGFNVLDAANSLAEHPDIRFAEPDMLFTGFADLIPTDPDFGTSWGLHNDGTTGGIEDMDMDAPEAWDISTGDASIIVAVIDNGVDTTHPDINQVAGTDVTSDGGSGGPFNVCDKHGSPVAGCISQIINNSLSTTGIAPSCKIASIRTFRSTLDCDGLWTSFVSWTVNALAWAETNGVKVTNNNSYGFTSSAIADKYATTKAAGMIHFASAGNLGSGTVGYPANLPDINAVGALNNQGEKAGFSQYGTGLQFCAPGEGILTTDHQGTSGFNEASGTEGDYVSVNGTSFASPYTAGVAALILSVAPFLTPTEVEIVMETTAMDRGDAGYDTTFGWGVPNAFAALAASSLDYSGYWVDKTHSGLQIGTEVFPMTSISDGLALVPAGESLHVESGIYFQSTSINQSVTILAENGNVVLGN